MPVFVDTNVLVYARDASAGDKQVAASEWVRHLWEQGTGRVSIQVLEEYYVTTTRTLDPGLTRDAARADVADLLAWRPVQIDAQVLATAWSIEDRFEISFWDALIAAAAGVADCWYLLTEDLGHGTDIDGVRVIDPFRTAVGSLE